MMTTDGREPHLATLAAWLIFLCCLLASYARVGVAEGRQQVPVFRSTLDAVAIDVVVVDAAGRPVSGLTAEDFEVIENGVSRPIATFEAVDLPVSADGGRSESLAEPDVLTNEHAVARSYVFALDEIGLDDALRVRGLLRTFLERYFGPNDVGAVVLVGRGLATDGQPFTNNPRLLLRAVERLSGGFPRGTAQPPGCLPAAARSEIHVDSRTGGSPPLPNSPINTNDFAVRQRMMALRSLVDSLVAVPNARKIVLYFTSCIGLDMREVADYRGAVLGLAAEDAHRLLAAASRSNVVFYPLDPRGLGQEGGLAFLEQRADLAALANVTGGFALSNSNQFLQAFEAVREDSRVFYSMAFESGYTKRDGRFVRVDVRVKRPGLQVRARDGYVAPLGKGSDRKESPGVSPAAGALAHAIATTGLTMRASAAPFKGTTAAAAAALTVEIVTGVVPSSDQSGTNSGELEVAYTAVDARNRAFPGGRHRVPLATAPRSRVSGEMPVRLVSTLTLPPGQYQVRVAAGIDTRIGSVVYDLEVPDYQKAPLSLSGVVLAVAGDEGAIRPPRATKRPARPVDCRPPTCVVPLVDTAPSMEDPLATLAQPPTTRRVFQRDEEVVVYAEAYTDGRRTVKELRLRASLEARDGSATALVSETRASSGKQRGAITERFTLRPSFRDIPPGFYVLRVEADVEGSAPNAAIRRVPIELR